MPSLSVRSYPLDREGSTADPDPPLHPGRDRPPAQGLWRPGVLRGFGFDAAPNIFNIPDALLKAYPGQGKLMGGWLSPRHRPAALGRHLLSWARPASTSASAQAAIYAWATAARASSTMANTLSGTRHGSADAAPTHSPGGAAQVAEA